jgi:hypothetical protein
MHSFRLPARWAIVVCAGLVVPWSAERAAAAEPPGVVELKVEPASLTLTGPRDSRRFVVRGKTAAGFWIDLTRSATAKVEGEAARLEDGFLVPVKDGKAEVVLSAGDKQAKLPVTVAGQGKAAPVSFVRDIMPILGKTGCNAGTCHGAQKGRNGFKLSLRGYDPAFDHEQMVEDISGRRIDFKEPANSLVLLKPTQGVPHEGKFVFSEKSRYYKLMHQWINEACPSDVATTKRVERLEVLPLAPVLSALGQEQQLIVVAYYPDGTSRDVTRDAVYTSSADTICTVNGDGLVKSERKGDAAILIRYEGQFAVNPLSVLVPNAEYKWTNPPANNYIDTLVYQKLQRIQVTPSELSSDANFLRRVYLDLLGIPPTPEEVRAFLADQRETQVKRRAVIDKLLDRPEYVDFWTMRWADVMQVNRKYLGEKGVWSFREWLRQQVAHDRPWNEMAFDLVTGVGSTVDAPQSAFWRIAREPNQAVENMTHLFLGIRFNCNKCHDHPFERWTQGDYYHLAAYFTQVGISKGDRADDEVVYQSRDGGEMLHPKTRQVMQPRFPFTHAGLPKESTGNRRAQLARWLTAPENPYFAKAMANRLWAFLNGRGIIDPVDDIRSTNPPINPALLDALTEDFIKSGFDARRLMRRIVTSETYQRTSVPNESNKHDEQNFSHAVPRRVPAEALLDSLVQATGVPEAFGGAPAGFRAAQLPDANVTSEFLKLFGKPQRMDACECERDNTSNMLQALNFINGKSILTRVKSANARPALLLKDKLTDEALVTELYLWSLARSPNAQEREAAMAFVKSYDGDRTAAAQDLMWALLNSKDFLLVH